MQFTTEEEKDLTIPEDSVLRARLLEIKMRTFEWTDNRTGELKEGESLDWWWEITDSKLGPDYVGRRVKGECRAKITNRESNQFRQWAEALLNRPIPVGMTVDTDDLVGLTAEVVVGHRPDRKNPGRKFEFVSDIIPATANEDADPPF